MPRHATVEEVKVQLLKKWKDKTRAEIIAEIADVWHAQAEMLWLEVV